MVGVGDMVDSDSVPVSLSLSHRIEEQDEEEGWEVSPDRHGCGLWHCELPHGKSMRI